MTNGNKATDAGAVGQAVSDASASVDQALTWEAAVEEGKSLSTNLDASRWRLGDILVALAPPGRLGVPQGQLAIVAKYAEAVGIEFRSAKDYRQTAMGPQGTRPSTSDSSGRRTTSAWLWISRGTRPIPTERSSGLLRT